MRWLRDYGTFIAATIAALAAIGNAWLQARRDSTSKREQWLRDLRLPRYTAFLRATDDYDTSIFMEYGEWEPGDMGPPPTPIPLPVAEHAFQQALAELVLVGPPNVSGAAQNVQYTMWRYRNDLDESPYSNTPRYRKDAIDRYLAAATAAMGVPFEPTEGPYGYRGWLKEQKAAEKAAEELKERST